MLPFELGNLNRVNRIVVRYEPMEVPRVGAQISRPPMHVRLFIDSEQVVFGAERQSSNGRQDGEMSMDAGGLKAFLMAMEQISGMKFHKQRKSQAENLEEYHRSDFHPAPGVVPPVFRISQAKRIM